MVTTSGSNDRILILGGGLSGLALAQALKSHDPPISFTVFERDEPQETSSNRKSCNKIDHQPQQARTLRSQGYRIRIGPDGSSALKRLLPVHLWVAFEATCAKVEEGMTRLDALTGRKTDLFGAGGPGGRPPMRPMVGGVGEFEDLVGGRAFNVDRATVRQLLLSGLEEGKDVVFGKHAEGYAVLRGSEGIEVRFSDGSVERGSFLVGADGVRSVVRRQMLPAFRLLDTEGRTVFGKTPISDDLIAGIPSPFFEGITVCKNDEESRLMLFCDVTRFDRHAVAKHADRVGVKVREDYIYWVLGFRDDVLGDPARRRELLHLSHDQSAELSKQLTNSWHPKIRKLLEQQDKDASSTLAILTSAPGFEQAWTNKPSETAGLVTVIGDAAHPMPPLGGVGANTAWQDAYDLFTALVSIHSATDSQTRIAAVQAYEAKLLARAKPTVERSARAAVHLMGIKPIEELKEVEWSH